MKKAKKYILIIYFILISLFTLPVNAADPIWEIINGNYSDLWIAIKSGIFKSAYAGEGGCSCGAPPHIFLDKLSGNCGCPSKPIIEISGCTVLVKCDLLDEMENVMKFNIPCPTAAKTDPSYPLVKMLSGTLVEWRVNENRIKAPNDLFYSAPGLTACGAEVFTNFDLDIIVSTVDVGKKWNEKTAVSIVKATEGHSRTNIKFGLENPGFGVAVLNAKEIYESYKVKSSIVQSYLSLALKDFGERPWTTYEEFVNNFCANSTKTNLCKKSLLGRDFLGRVGNYYLGNGNPTLLGVYSEASSHKSHGATRVNDKGQPAWGIRFLSTFYVYFDAKWQDHGTYGNVQSIKMGPSCVGITQSITQDLDRCAYDCSQNNEHCNDCPYLKTVNHCSSWVDMYACVDDFIMSGYGESKENCVQTVNISGWLDKKGNASTKPYPISFYQSQPLLINENSTGLEL